MSYFKKNKPFAVILLIQVIILLFAAGNFIFCKTNLYNMVIFPNELECEADVVYGEKVCANTQNSAGGIFASTVPLELKRGSYLVYVNYHTDAAGNKISASATDIPAHSFQSNANRFIEPADGTTTLAFRINTPGEIVIHAEYCGTGSFEISQLNIVETTDMAKQDFLYAVFFCLLLMFGYYICTTTLSKKKTCLALSAIVLLSSYPLFMDFLLVGHDIPFHLLRIDGIKEGLQNGTFPVKIYPMLVRDHGYAVGVFYGDILMYIPALLRSFGFTLQSSYQVFLFIINAATVFISYFCFKKLFQSNKWGLCASMLYTLSSYRLINVYTRGAVGEFCAMIFLPILFLGFYNIYTQKKNKFNWKLAILPAIGLSGIIQTHTLSCIMVAIFILFTCILFIKKTLRPHTFFTLLLTVGLTLFLNAGFLVPFADYYFTEDFIINSSEWGRASVENYGLFFTQIFSMFFDSVGPTSSTSIGLVGDFGPTLGLTLSLGFFVCIYYLFTAKKEEYRNSGFILIGFTFVCAALAIWMASYLFPWDAIANSGKLGASLALSLQFPWRFLSMATLFITVCLCQVLKNMSEQTESKNALSFSSVAILLLCISTVISSGWYYYSFLYSGSPYRVYETYELPSYQIYTCEYLPLDTELNEIVYKRYEASSDIHIAYEELNGTTLTVQLQNFGSDGYLEVPLIHYKGYAAVDTQTGTSLSITNGFNNCIRVEIPAGYDGTMEVAFREPFYWRIAEVISALTVLFLLAMPFIKCVKKKKGIKTTE